MLFVCLIHVGAWRCVRCIGFDVFFIIVSFGHVISTVFHDVCFVSFCALTASVQCIVKLWPRSCV